MIVLITIIASSKNNYSPGFLKTDSEGKIIVFRAAIEEEIRKSMDLFIMDYSSNINDCKDCIIIEVENISELEIRQKNIERFYPENAKELSKLMNTCSNKSYKTLNIEYEIDSNIKITVQNIKEKTTLT